MKQLLSLFITLLFSNAAWSHSSGVTDTNIKLGASTVRIIYTVPNDHLETQLDLSNPAFIEHISGGFAVKNSEIQCNISSVDTRALESIGSTQFILLFNCDKNLSTLSIRYSLLFDAYPNHRNLARISIAGRYQSFIFTAEKPTYQIFVSELLKLWNTQLSDQNGSRITSASTSNMVQSDSGFELLSKNSSYFSLGFEHILLGFDHILFLIGLLLLPLQFKQLALMITAFTFAHSITLAISVLNIVSVPPVFVEAAIAFSIVYVALENLWETRNHQHGPALSRAFYRRGLVTFIFGLVHGFGFSYILKEIGFGDQWAVPLLLFNGGVEVGQLLIVILVYPVLLFAFKHDQGLTFSRASSAIVGLVGCGWLIERVM